MSYVLNVRNCFSLERMQRLTRCYFYSEGIYSLVAEYHSMLMSSLPKKGGGMEEREKEIKEQKVVLRNTVFIIILQIKIYKLHLLQLALLMLCGSEVLLN